jgi:hypothetical protein
MKQCFTLLFTAIVCLISCSSDQANQFYSLINQNFLVLIDTVAYKTGRLIAIPGDTISDYSGDAVCIMIDENVNLSTDFSSGIKKIIRVNHLDEFNALITGSKNIDFEKLDLSRLKNTGRYPILPLGKFTESSCTVVAGTITFYRPYLSKKEAIIVYSVADGQKSGYTNCVFFKKDGRVWNNVGSFQLEVW